MARKHSLPGVDEQALSELARQFPSHDVEPPPLPGEAAKQPAAAVSRGGRGGGAVAVAVSVVALAIAAAALAAPHLRPQLTQWFGDGQIVAALYGDRMALERALAEERAARGELERRLGERLERAGTETGAVATRVDDIAGRAGRAEARLDTIEAVGGGFDNAARRVAAAEASFGAAAARIDTVARDAQSTGQRVEALRDEIATLQRELRAADESQANRITALEPKLAEMEQKMTAAIEQRVTAAATQAAEAGEAAAAATRRAEEVERSFGELRQFNRSSVRLFLIALHLRTAVQSPAPFTREVQALRGIAANTPEAAAPLRVLGEHATNGVRTVTELRDVFASTVGTQIKALAAGLDESWSARVTTMLVGPQMPKGGEGERVWRVVAQAEQALAQGNLAAAVNQVERFDGAAGAMAADWLRDAKARLAVENAAASLSIYALNQLVGGGI
jgi:hypothetical protein